MHQTIFEGHIYTLCGEVLAVTSRLTRLRGPRLGGAKCAASW